MYIVIIVVIIIFFLCYRSSKIKGKTGEEIVRKILEKVTGYKKIINKKFIYFENFEAARKFWSDECRDPKRGDKI